MSEYELADLAASVSADSLVFLPLMLSIVEVATRTGHFQPPELFLINQ
jgi:hypothetical protein